ncbi:hypothetical protein Stube_31610 [Streptomyces tubercidicus]|uniref:Uncharacterized protein n=2 Tax=Streptomyces tubercidicus TaxID=47759 RepID=A0A640UQW1_9ACTN|nr:hypothetical protein Stube_31610 [Streptomyces tubercidicus]
MWHAVADDYMKPENVRMHLNSLMQGMRNVTFMLQKQKSTLPGFEEWYTEFQVAAKSNPLMRWSVNSRNRIVKESDLELLSEAKVRWIGDWVRKQERNFAFPPRMSSKAILATIFSDPGNPQMGVVTISRRWVDKALPGREILSATREVFIILSALIAAAHNAASSEECGLGAREPACVTPALTAEPLACMDINPGWLQEHLDLEAGRGIEEVAYFIEQAPESHRKSQKWYGSAVNVQGNPIEVAPQIMEQAGKALTRDKKHVPLIWFFRDDVVVDSMVPIFFDQNGKYLTMHRVADRVESLRANGVIFLNEAWYTTDEKLDKDGRIIPPRDRRRDRREALHVLVATESGKYASLLTPFTRTVFGKIILGESNIDTAIDLDTDGQFNVLRPVIDRWGKA